MRSMEMREILFRGKRKDFDNEWIYGFYTLYNNNRGMKPTIVTGTEENCFILIEVIPETVGQFTGMKEFVVSDRAFNKPLFEGDIVEVWGWRGPKYTYDAKSQYDGKIKVRAVICFKSGEWTLDYTNKYNESLAKLKGKEVDAREVTGEWSLYRYQRHNGNEDWYREHNTNFKWSDIVKIGNVFDNADLLEE